MTLMPDVVPGRLRLGLGAGLWPRRASRVLERNLVFYRHAWLLVISGALEPVFYLLSAKLGLGKLVGRIPGPDGRLVSYAVYVGPALLAASAANGVIFDTTYNFFEKLKHAKTYDAMLATPLAVRDVALGELAWALLRGLVHAATFVAVMALLGLLRSPWAVLALPAVLVVEWAFAAMGLAATTYVRTWQDFDWQQLLWLPMFLLSASFFPLSVYPDAMQWVVRATPLYQGVALVRAVMLGGVGWSSLGHVVYLVVLGVLALRHATRRMAGLLLR